MLSGLLGYDLGNGKPVEAFCCKCARPIVVQCKITIEYTITKPEPPAL